MRANDATAPSSVPRKGGAARFAPLLRVVRHGVAPSLVLLAPFVAFLRYQQYSFGAAEAVLCLTAIVAIGLALGAVAAIGAPARVLVLAAVLIFFLDIQTPGGFSFGSIGPTRALGLSFIVLACLLWLLRKHAERVVTAMAATILISTLLVPTSHATVVSKTQGPAGRSDLPLVVHIIVDEHIGIDGLPPETTVPALRADLQSFYQSLGFRTFDRAYSEYARTELSLAQELNLSPGRYRPDLLRLKPPRFAHGLAQNAYFRHMTDLGYALHVYQSDYLQLCPHQGAKTCETYPAAGIAVLQDLPLSAVDKMRLIAGTYLDISKLNHRAIAVYGDLRRRLDIGLRLAAWSWSDWTTPLNSAQQMRHFARELTQAKGGELYFAHFMLPHKPYVYDANCVLLPVAQWRGRESTDSLDRASRTTAYASYDPQVRCTSRLIQEIVGAVPPDLRPGLVMIVQGDHGSRLILANHDSISETMTAEDYRDRQSTLFAVRSPGLTAGSDRRFVPLTCLLGSLVSGRFQALPDLERCAQRPSVFVTDRNGRVTQKPMPPFSGGLN